MGKRPRDEADGERHGIRIPGSLLDELKGANGGEEDDARFQSGMDGKKRKTVSRKERRKMERQSKKKNRNDVRNGGRRHAEGGDPNSGGNVRDKPKSAKVSKLEKKEEEDHGDGEEQFSDFGGFPDESGDEDLQSGDSDNYGDFDEELDSDLESFEDEDEDEDQPQTVEDTMATLMALKNKKKMKKDESQPQTAQDTMNALKLMKEKKQKAKESESSKEPKKTKSKKSEHKRVLTPEERRLMKRDEDDMKYYAKKLGLKSTKSKDFKNKQDEDGLGDLLDGLDFLDAYGDGIEGEEDYEEDYEEDLDGDKEFDEDDSDEEEGGDEEEADDDEEEEEIVENPFSSDDEINSSDFDSDIDPEASDDEEGGDVIMAKPKENPYAPAVSSSTQTKTKYIPPALRAKMNTSDNSEQMVKIKRSIKGPLNRLSEANVMTIVNDILAVYLENPRQLVTECLTTVVLESVVQQTVLLDTFVTLHAALMSAIYRSQGVEAGAYFIQTLVEKYDEYYKANETKKASNLVTLLTASYSFQIVSCKLLYSLISELIQEVSEINSELLLRIIRNAGQQMRSDDPNALKEIIVQFQKNIQVKETNARTKFLIESITNLKNNRLKTVNENTAQLITRMRKLLANVTKKPNEPLQVTLEDIHSVNTKGKWWLVGSAWKGNDLQHHQEVEVNEEELNNVLDSAEPNWVELAKAQRMNTDIRRAIFISIMSSEDYIDAFTKLDKLRLKRSQEREIPKILLHCVSIEKVYNPYYGLLANKLCSDHGTRKTFQFGFWDLLHELEGEDEDDADGDVDYFKRLSKDIGAEDDDFTMQRLVNQGKFYGALMAEGTLPLHSLKNVNFLALNPNLSLFLEILMISFLDNVGKKSEVSTFGNGTKKSRAQDLQFNDTLLVERLGKCQSQTVLLRGLQYFLQEKVRGSDIISGRKQKRRVDWGVDCICDVCDELLKQAD